MTRLPLLAILPALMLSSAVDAKDKASDWEELSSEEGITVWQREVEGTSFVEFRGRGVVQASIKHVTAALRDNQYKTEWMHNCGANFAIQFFSTNDLVTYNLTKSPAFFISDRDTVLRVKAKIDPEKKTILVNFENTKHPKMPEREDAVRMPRLKGYWLMEALDAKSTRITYQVQADPGGALPAWLVNLVSKDMPWHTIANLRKQLKKRDYAQEHMILERVIDWAPFGIQVAGAEPDEKTKTSSAARGS